jgi:hypothetical protein
VLVVHRRIGTIVASAFAAVMAVVVVWVSAAWAIPSYKSSVGIAGRELGNDKVRLVGEVKSAKFDCYVTRRVSIWRKVSGPDEKLGVDDTDIKGNWVGKGFSVGRGTYYAKIEQDRRGSSAAKIDCLGDRSPDLVVS